MSTTFLDNKFSQFQKIIVKKYNSTNTSYIVGRKNDLQTQKNSLIVKFIFKCKKFINCLIN